MAAAKKTSKRACMHFFANNPASEAMGVTQGRVSQIERGAARLDTSTMAAYLHAIGGESVPVTGRPSSPSPAPPASAPRPCSPR